MSNIIKSGLEEQVNIVGILIERTTALFALIEKSITEDNEINHKQLYSLFSIANDYILDVHNNFEKLEKNIISMN